MKTHGIRGLAGAWLALLLLLGLTVGSAYIPMGTANVVANYAIAFAKAAIVMVVYMHATRSGRVVRILALVGLAWLLVLGSLGLTDYATRAPVTRPQAGLSQGR